MSTVISNANSTVTNQEKKISTMPCIVLGIAALIVGFIAALLTFVRGQDVMFSMNQHVRWGLLIVSYAFFMVTSSGLAFIGGLGHAFGVKNFHNLANRIVIMAFVFLLAGFTQIGMDLGHPFRLWVYMLISANLSAPIVWMGLLYSLELILLAVELVLIFRSKKTAGNETTKKVIGILAMIVGIMAAGTLGLAFGVNRAVPFYFGGFFSMFFIVSGIVSAVALLLLVLNLVYKWQLPGDFNEAVCGLGKIMTAGIAAMILLYVWKLVFDLGFDDVTRAIHQASGELVAGSFALNFWLGEILFAVLLPLILLGASRMQNGKLLGLAGLSFLVGFFFTKYDAIIVGQLAAGKVDLAGNPVSNSAIMANYLPEVGEWLIFILGFGVFLTLYFLAERLFSRQIRTA